MSAITRRAPAKLNLFLHITGKRADGYHLLESLVTFTELADVLTFEPADRLTLAVTGEFADHSGHVDDNLVLRAARALQAHTGSTLGARISLAKHIPVGAGLGGGSADAAATLMGLNQLWQLGLSPKVLHALAVPLGADVAMCLSPAPALVRGIGEEIQPLRTPLPRMAALLVHPRTALLTADVYRVFSLAAAHPAHWPDAPADFWHALVSQTTNHLQPAAMALSPRVAELLHALEALPTPARLVRMTGSGACCFALMDDLAQAEQAKAQLHQQHPSWWAAATPLIS